MKLYTTSRAPNPRRVDLFLAVHQTTPEALGIEVVTVDLVTTQNKNADFLAINPLGQLPALVLDDGQAICDSVAICRYIETVLLPDNDIKLFGYSPLSAVQIEQYYRHAELEVFLPLAYAFQLSHPFWIGKKEQLPAFAPIGLARARAGFAYFDTLLQDKTYLVDAQLSVADLTLYTAVDFGRLAGLKVDQTYPHLFAFYQRMHARFATV